MTPLRAYDTRANTSGLQQVAVIVESAPNVAAGRRCGARIDLQCGQATETVRDTGEPVAPDGFFTVLDTYVNWAPTPALTFAFDVNHVTNEVRQEDDALALTGLAGYARYQVAAPAAVAVRYERLDDEGRFAGIDQVLQEVTVTYDHRLGDGLLVRGECRRDRSNAPFFTGAVAGALRREQDTFTAGLIWWFGNKQGVW